MLFHPLTGHLVAPKYQIVFPYGLLTRVRINLSINDKHLDDREFIKILLPCRPAVKVIRVDIHYLFFVSLYWIAEISSLWIQGIRILSPSDGDTNLMVAIVDKGTKVYTGPKDIIKKLVTGRCDEATKKTMTNFVKLLFIRRKFERII